MQFICYFFLITDETQYKNNSRGIPKKNRSLGFALCVRSPFISVHQILFSACSHLKAVFPPPLFTPIQKQATTHEENEIFQSNYLAKTTAKCDVLGIRISWINLINTITCHKRDQWTLTIYQWVVMKAIRYTNMIYQNQLYKQVMFDNYIYSQNMLSYSLSVIHHAILHQQIYLNKIV